ncbi:MAG: hypothetical protein IPL91_15860 [Hyphomicrobium sp.]|nr:hypothetical protein [Hyphomicrobium sp.]
MAKAIRLADKTKARPEKVVISQPKSAELFAKKPAAKVLSERLYTRVTSSKMKRLKPTSGQRPDFRAPP